MIRKLTAIAGLSLALAAGGHANATTINLDPSSFGIWQTIDVDDSYGPSFSTNWADIATRANDGSLLSYRFSTTQDLLLKVVDSGFTGDVFKVFDNGVELGNTSATVASDFIKAYGSSQADFDAAYADPDFSKRLFFLGAGTHVITGLLFSSENGFNATVGGLQITPIPVPPAIVGLLSGLGLLAGAARRRRA
jgi:hypothetical protein